MRSLSRATLRIQTVGPLLDCRNFIYALDDYGVVWKRSDEVLFTDGSPMDETQTHYKLIEEGNVSRSSVMHFIVLSSLLEPFIVH